VNLRNSPHTVALTIIVFIQLALTPHAGAQPGRFHLDEATIAGVHRAIRAKQITATQLVQLYFKRIETYNGVCVKGDVDPATG
jgi:amidase